MWALDALDDDKSKDGDVYLGIDLGTSAVKVCCVADTGDVVETVSIALTTSQPFLGASEQDCNAWWLATCQAVRKLDTRHRDHVKAIGLSGQMHGAVLLNKAKQPIRPAILWNDARATAECDALVAAVPDVGEVTGVYPMAGFTAPKLLWLARHTPERHAEIAHVLLPKDYIGFRLHGNLVTDPSDAAGTSWMDQRTRTWSRPICDASATDPACLPRILYGNEIAGELCATAASDLGLPPETPIVAGAGDAAAGAVGIGAIENGDGFLSLGTSGQMFVTTNAYRPNVDSRIHAYAHTLPDIWFQMAAMLNGARPIAWLANLLDRPIDALLAEADTATDSPIFLPYLTGERTPHGDSDIRAGFFGLSETTTHGALMRSVIEAIAFSFADASDALQAAGTTTDRLLAIGGGTRSSLLMQTISNVLGCDIGRSDGADVGPALGAARLAMLAHCKSDTASIVTKPPVGTWFTPQSEHAGAMAEKLAVYRALYPAVKAAQAAKPA